MQQSWNLKPQCNAMQGTAGLPCLGVHASMADLYTVMGSRQILDLD